MKFKFILLYAIFISNLSFGGPRPENEPMGPYKDSSGNVHFSSGMIRKDMACVQDTSYFTDTHGACGVKMEVLGKSGNGQNQTTTMVQWLYGSTHYAPNVFGKILIIPWLFVAIQDNIGCPFAKFEFVEALEKNGLTCGPRDLPSEDTGIEAESTDLANELMKSEKLLFAQGDVISRGSNKVNFPGACHLSVSNSGDALVISASVMGGSSAEMKVSQDPETHQIKNLGSGVVKVKSILDQTALEISNIPEPDSFDESKDQADLVLFMKLDDHKVYHFWVGETECVVKSK